MITIKVLCVDGKVRTATVTGSADTWFSLPARVKVNGKTVSGFISSGFPFGLLHKSIPKVWQFDAYKYRANHAEIVSVECKREYKCSILLDGITKYTCDDCRHNFNVLVREVIAANPEIVSDTEN